jgi:hypothetical protein
LGDLAHYAEHGQHTIRASSIAWLSAGKFSEKQTDDVSILTPLYVRKSDAELNAQEI